MYWIEMKTISLQVQVVGGSGSVENTVTQTQLVSLLKKATNKLSE